MTPAFEKNASKLYEESSVAFGVTYSRAEAVSNDFVYLTSSYPDLIDFSRRSYSQVCPLLSTKTISPSPIDPKLKAWARKGEIEFRAFESEKNQLTMEILKFGRPIVRRSVKQAKDAYNGGPLGCPVVGEDFVALMIEPSDPSYSKGWWNGAVPNGEKKLSVVDKFKYIPSFGEALTKVFEPKLMLFGFDGSVRIVDAPENHIFAAPAVRPSAQSSPASDEIIVVGYKQEYKLQKPGVSVCFNREASLFRIIIERTGENESAPVITDTVSNQCCTSMNSISTALIQVTRLSEHLLFVSLAPVFHPSGDRFCFVGKRDPFATHCTMMDIYLADWKGNKWEVNRLDLVGNEVTDLVINGEGDFAVKSTSSIGQPSVFNQTLFPGLFQVLHEEGRNFRFLDNSLVLSSNFYGEGAVFIYTETTNNLMRIDLGGSSTLLDITPDGTLVIVSSSFLIPQRVWAVKLSRDSAGCFSAGEVIPLTPPSESVCDYQFTRIHSENSTGWLLSKSGVTFEEVGEAPPLLVKIHGGPHACAMNAFSLELACYLKSGFNVLMPNYRGSGGFGSAYLDDLAGKVGEMDVDDCAELTTEAVKYLSTGSLAKTAPVIAYGGSHGGFLTGWLLAKFPALFSAGVLWNPVVDLLASNLTSDIPEWSVACVNGLKVEKFPCSASFNDQFVIDARKKSPPVDTVVAPSLVVLGASDLRVNAMAGLRWAQAAEELGKKVDVLWYPEQGHSIAGPEASEHVTVSVLAWILQQSI